MFPLFLVMALQAGSPYASCEFEPRQKDEDEPPKLQEADIVELIATLDKDKSPELRLKAAQELGHVKSPDQQVLKSLLNAMEGDKDEDVRSSAAYSLRNREIHSEEVAAAFKRALKDANSVRVQAAHGLVKIEDPKVTTPLLLEAMRGTNSRTIYSIAHALGDEKVVDVPAISKAFTDKDKYVRAGAAMTLGFCCYDNKKIGQQSELLKLLPLLDDREAIVRSEAAETLGFVNEDRKRCIPALIKALQDEDTYVRGSAASTLGAFGPEAGEAVDKLISLTSDKEAHVRECGYQALGSIGVEGKRVIPLLIKGLQDDHAFVRFRCAGAIRDMGLEAKEFFPTLLNAWKDSDKTEKSILARVLYKIDADLAEKSGVPREKD